MTPWKAGCDGPSLQAMTCDVEDYFQVSAFSDRVPRDDWEKLECRIPRNVDRILERLSAAGARATFFTLGWVARHYPQVVRNIVSAGHEIASHGMQHIRVWRQSPMEFLTDAASAKKLLEDVAGVEVAGYRAASWSIDQRSPWAYEKLAEAGYRYSSSIYPIQHDHFGMPDAPTNPHFVDGSGVLEVPASVARVLGRNIPASGGGYFRLFPLSLSTWLIDRIVASNERPFVFYFHPWELDPGQPRIPDLPARTRFRHYLNLARFENRLNALLERYRWGRMDEIYLAERAR